MAGRRSLVSRKGTKNDTHQGTLILDYIRSLRGEEGIKSNDIQILPHVDRQGPAAGADSRPEGESPEPQSPIEPHSPTHPVRPSRYRPQGNCTYYLPSDVIVRELKPCQHCIFFLKPNALSFLSHLNQDIPLFPQSPHLRPLKERQRWLLSPSFLPQPP